MIEYTNLGVFMKQAQATWRILLFTLEMRPFIPSIRGIQCCLEQLRNDRQLLTLILVLELVVFMLVDVGIGAWSVCLVSMLQQSMLARKVWLALASASLGSNKQPDESKTTLYSATEIQKPNHVKNVMALVSFEAVHIHSRRINRKTIAAVCSVALHLHESSVFFVRWGQV